MEEFRPRQNDEIGDRRKQAGDGRHAGRGIPIWKEPGDARIEQEHSGDWMTSLLLSTPSVSGEPAWAGGLIDVEVDA